MLFLEMAFNHTFTYNPSFKPKYTIESRIKSLTPTTFPSNCYSLEIEPDEDESFLSTKLIILDPSISKRLGRFFDRLKRIQDRNDRDNRKKLNGHLVKVTNVTKMECSSEKFHYWAWIESLFLESLKYIFP